MLTVLLSGLAACVPALPLHFEEVAAQAGLGDLNATRVKFVDLDQDGKPDILLTDATPSHRVFMNRSDAHAVRFVELPNAGLPPAATGDCVVAADLDGDELPDLILTRYLDLKNPKFTLPPAPAASCWCRGSGDGHFGSPNIIDAATRGTTAAIAVGDVNRDGWLDLYLGLWYTRYGETNEAYGNDLLLSTGGPAPLFTRSPLPTDGVAFDEDKDLGGRPTYGLMILPRLEPHTSQPALLDLSYGRRWNRLWVRNEHNAWLDAAPALHLDGDDIRHGHYPAAAKREDEKPYRSNGNNFDAALADVDNDGSLDLFISAITHWWAGDSSDRSRFLISRGDHFESPSRMTVDRIPADPNAHWNQGDIFCELADLDQDGRVDLLLASGEYPDLQKLRYFHQEDDGSMKDLTDVCGLNLQGAGQIALADVDGDGDLDIIAGQIFNRLTAEQRAGKSPRLHLYLNRSSESGGTGLLLRLHDPAAPNHAGLGAIVTARTQLPGAAVQKRVLIGIGGCSGKQHDFVVHFGLGGVQQAQSVHVLWPDGASQDFGPLPAGVHTLQRAHK